MEGVQSGDAVDCSLRSSLTMSHRALKAMAEQMRRLVEGGALEKSPDHEIDGLLLFSHLTKQCVQHGYMRNFARGRCVITYLGLQEIAGLERAGCGFRGQLLGKIL